MPVVGVGRDLWLLKNTEFASNQVEGVALGESPPPGFAVGLIGIRNPWQRLGTFHRGPNPPPCEVEDKPHDHPRLSQ